MQPFSALRLSHGNSNLRLRYCNRQSGSRLPIFVSMRLPAILPHHYSSFPSSFPFPYVNPAFQSQSCFPATVPFSCHDAKFLAVFPASCHPFPSLVPFSCHDAEFSAVFFASCHPFPSQPRFPVTTQSFRLFSLRHDRHVGILISAQMCNGVFSISVPQLRLFAWG